MIGVVALAVLAVTPAAGLAAPPKVEALVESLTTLGPSYDQRRAAIEALTELDSATKAEAVDGLIAGLAHDSFDVRLAAAQGLRALGPIAAPAVPALAAALEDPTLAVRGGAAKTLAAIGPAAAPAVPALIATLDDPERSYRMEGSLAEALAGIGPDAAPAVPQLVTGLDNQWRDVRRRMANALAAIGPGAADAIPRLGESVRDDPEWSVRIAAADALAAIGNESLSLLLELLADPDARSRDLALRAIAKLDQPPPDLADHLLAYARTAEYSERAQLLRAYIALESDPERQLAELPAFVRARESEDWQARPVALEGLSALGPPGVPALLELLSEDPRQHGPIFGGAADPTLVRAITAMGDRAIPPLIAALDARRAEIRQAAAGMLLLLWPEAETVDMDRVIAAARANEPAEAITGLRTLAARVPDSDVLKRTVIEVLDGRPQNVRLIALRLLQDRDLHDASVEGRLVALLDEPDSKVAFGAASALVIGGGPRDRAVPILVDTAIAARDMDAAAAVKFLVEGGVEHEDILAGLTRIFDEAPYRDIRASVIYEASQARPIHPGVVALMARALDDPEPRVRERAVIDLRFWGAPARPFIGDLIAALDEPRMETRWQAAWSLASTAQDLVDTDTESARDALPGLKQAEAGIAALLEELRQRTAAAVPGYEADMAAQREAAVAEHLMALRAVISRLEDE